MLQIQKINFEEEGMEIKKILEREAQKVGFWVFPFGNIIVYHYNGLTAIVHQIHNGVEEKVKVQVFR